jgi:hypothetical protein
MAGREGIQRGSNIPQQREAQAGPTSYNSYNKDRENKGLEVSTLRGY